MAGIPATCEVWIDGVRYADGSSGENPADPFALVDLTVVWGRPNTVDQPSPATCTFTILDPPGGSVRFDETVALGSTVVVWSELNGGRTVVFGGRITDLAAEFDQSAGAGACHVIAADLLADLGNRFVGAEPWPMEAAGTRVNRILTAAGVATGGVIMDARPVALQLTRMDVDRQAAGALLLDVAVSTGSVLWSAYDPGSNGPYLFFEDPALRESLNVFSEDTTVVPPLWAPAPGTGAGTPLTACNVLEDPVQWVRAVTDLITRVTVSWADQTTSPGTTDRSVGLVSPGAEAIYGARGLSVGTGLTSSADATTLANGLLASHQPSPAWRTEGLTWDFTATDTDEEASSLAFALLGNITRLGHAIALTDLPYWTPTTAAVQLYIEGGSYTYTVDDAGVPRWVLALVGVPATGLGGSLTYDKTDLSVRYVDVKRSVTYLDMIGVGPAGPTGKDWQDLTGTWEQLPGRWADL